MKRTLIAIAALALAVSGTAYSNESITVELPGAALLIMANDAAGADLEAKIEDMKKRAGGAEELEEMIAAEFGDSVKVELFESPAESTITGLVSLTMTMREAQLRGYLPPLEGLEREAAAGVLRKMGFTVVEMAEFGSGKSGEIAEKAYISGGRLVAFEGTGAFDEVRLLAGE